MTTEEIEVRRQNAAFEWYIKELWDWRLENASEARMKNAEDGKSILKTILIAAKGDGVLAPQEKNWVIGLASAMGVPNEVVQELEAYEANEDIVEVISQTGIGKKSQRVVIYNAIKAAAADGVYHEGEKKEIRRAASAMGISEEVVEEIEKLYAEEEGLKAKRAQICFPDGNPFPQ